MNIKSAIQNYLKLISMLFIFLSLSSCFAVSQHHLGVHNLGNHNFMYAVVKKESVINLQDFEERCIFYLTNYELEKLRPSLAPQIGKALSDNLLYELNKTIRETYGFNGAFERLTMVHKTRVMDEGAGKEAFEYYDLVGAYYHLKGKIDAVIKLFMTQIDGETKLSGFVIMDYIEKQEGNNPVIEHIYPESIDKARLIGRGYRIIR